jgi:hypothetical protein
MVPGFVQSFEAYGPRNSPENKPTAYFRFVINSKTTTGAVFTP